MAEQGTGPDPLDPGSLPEDQRLQSLDRRLQEAQAGETDRLRAGQPDADTGYRLGNRVLAELLGGMIGGALLGWLIDRVAGTSPWGLLVMLSLGIVVAFRQILKITATRPD